MVSWIVQKRKITILFSIMFMLVGVLSFIQLPQREIPEISPAVAQITTVYPGASAEEVEQLVTNELELQLEQMTEIASLTSISTSGVSLVTVELEEGVDANQLWNEVRQRITTASAQFPNDVQAPQMNNNLSVQGLATYQLTFDEDNQLSEVNEVIDRWNKRLVQLPDITTMQAQGALDKEISIQLDAAAMEENEVSVNQMIGVLNGELETIPPGEWKTEEYDYRVELNTYNSVSELESLPVGFSAENGVISIGDVATITETFKPATETITFNGEEAISLTFYLREGASVPKAQVALDSFVEEMRNDLPTGVEMTLLYSQAGLVEQLFKDLGISFAIAIVSVLVVCSLGLNVSTALSVALAIPVSLSLGAIVFPYTGVDLNQISLIAIIIALGILVDDGIVVNENIERRLKLGDKPFMAAINGTKEVTVSVITSTLTVVFTFLPLLLLPGQAGAFIRPLPVVLIATMIASTLVALFLIPIYRSLQKEKKTRKSPGLIGPVFDKAASFYSKKLMTKVSRKPLLTVIIGFVLGTAAYGLIPFIPLEFFPDTDREEVFVEMKLPEGTSLLETERQSKEVEEFLSNIEYVDSVSTYVGTNIPRLFGPGGGGVAGDHVANFFVFINKDKISTRQARDIWSDVLKEQFSNKTFTVSMIESGPPVGAPIAIQVKGDSIERLTEMTTDIKEILATADGVSTVSDDIGAPLKTIQFTPNRSELEASGLSSGELAQTLRLMGDGIPIGQLQQQEGLIDLRVSFDANQVDINDIMLQTPRAGMVALSELVTEKESFTKAQIPHKNNVRTVTVRAYPTGDVNSDEILTATREQMEAVVADEGYQLVIGGETSARTDVFIDIGKIFIVVVFLILIVVAIQFYSLTIPILIMSTVYLAIAGALLGLFITQTGLGFMSMMGAVSLAGIVVRNGIVLMEFIEQRRKEGLGPVEAVIQASEQRFRPIVLTTLTSIAGLLPIALGNSTLFKPLGIAIVSGLVFSTLLTLFIVPALYLVQSKWRREKKVV
ncbi:efflux RND transporter permease subunit [Halalkalibacter akibai]|uniref:RND multidrug efflux transporter n=1 Tax=Halalkalibacter akibai (strain ATCC 43226 / DSM 21942 / CIP 109018 / JCM 9157 / 1139) TaxID=1236973 RepID=W4QP29_HALA3|nr:efflux RND transporter permease subunit [Halalkalibacter akibai]GAE33662.1 RND multidrug efflux transporter [Halalkalibacter akibai JCM 9157]